MTIETQPIAEPEEQTTVLLSQGSHIYRGHGDGETPTELPVLTTTAVQDMVSQMMPIITESENTPDSLSTEEIVQLLQIFSTSQLPEYYKTQLNTIGGLLVVSNRLRNEYIQAQDKNEVLSRIMSMSIDIAKASIDFMAPNISENVAYSLSYEITNDAGDGTILPSHIYNMQNNPADGIVMPSHILPMPNN